MKFLHLADVHLDAAYDMFSADLSRRAREKQFEALEHAVRIAHQEQVQCVLIAGDLFDTPSPSAAAFSRAMSTLSQFDCPVFLVAGNHDHLYAESPYLTSRLPQNVHLFAADHLESVALNEQYVIWGASFHAQTASIPLPILPQNDGKRHLCVIHADLRSDNGYNHYAPDQIAQSGFSYMAVGHNHTPSGLQRAGRTVYCCPGPMASLSVKESGPKGFLLIDMENTVKAQFIQSKGVEFMDLTIDLSPIPSDTGLQKVLIDRIPAHHERVWAQLTLTGERVYEPNLPALRRVLDQIFFSCEVIDRTTLKKPLWRYLQQDDLRGAVSRRYRDMIEAASGEEEKNALIYSLRCALAAFDGDDLPNPVLADND